jgi:RNA-directed DNA polymerase
MTPRDVFTRAIVAALLDGEWEPLAMVGRMRKAIGEERPWMNMLALVVMGSFATAPANAAGKLAAWLYTRPELTEALQDEHPIVHFATPPPEMAESPWNVPALATTRELATWIGFDLDTLDVLADRHGISRASDPKARHYRYAWLPKRAGGARLVEAPKWRLRVAQRRILDGILAHIPPHEAAHGFREGRSVISFARSHVGRAVVLRVDLQAFFTSVHATRVFGILHTAGYPEEVSRTITALCTHRTPSDVLARAPERDPVALSRMRSPHLPQGAPSSGTLSNLAAYRLDVRVAGLAAKLGARYTRYADDLVLSGDRALVRHATTIVARLATIASDEGFLLNFRKTRVMTASDRQRVTGVVVNEKLSASRRDLDRLRAILHNCVRHGPASQNRDDHPDFRAHLRGRIAWVASLDPAKGARLRAMFDEIRWADHAAFVIQ